MPVRAGHRNRIRVRPYNLRLPYGYGPYYYGTVYGTCKVADGTVRPHYGRMTVYTAVRHTIFILMEVQITAARMSISKVGSSTG